MILIADSGGTKTDWTLLDGAKVVSSLRTEGLHPVFSTPEEIVAHVRAEVVPALAAAPAKIFFYAAGLVSQASVKRVEDCFREVFPGAVTQCSSDLLGAARALFGEQPGVACILGTGSNSCFYDGDRIADNIRAGGFILGDEGSGAHLGRLLISDFIKGLLPADLGMEFVRKYGLDYPAIVAKVYREPNPNKFLASFSVFIEEHRKHPYMQRLLRESFRLFLQRNASRYGHEDCPVGFVGSIAFVFREELCAVMREEGLIAGAFMKSPMEGLIRYHSAS